MLSQEEVISRIDIRDESSGHRKQFFITDQDGEEVEFYQAVPETFLVITRGCACEVPTSFLKELAEIFE